MRPAQLCQGEMAPSGELMYVLQFGVVVLGGNIKTAPSVWGDDVIVSDRHRRSRANARALSEMVEVLVISRATIMRCAASHPEAMAHIRKCAIKLALRHELFRPRDQCRRQLALSHPLVVQLWPAAPALLLLAQDKQLVSAACSTRIDDVADPPARAARAG